MATFTKNDTHIFAFLWVAILVHEYRISIGMIYAGDKCAALLRYVYNDTVFVAIRLPFVARRSELFEHIMVNAGFIKLKCRKFNIIH